MSLTLDRAALGIVFGDLGFEPNAAQWPIYEYMVEPGARACLVAGGERAGKSLTAGEWLTANVILATEPRLFWIVGAEYEDAKPEFSYTFDDMARLGGIRKSSTPEHGQQVLETLTGVRVATMSAHDPEKLAREAPDGVLMTEAGRHSWTSYLRLRGRVAEKRGWIWISGTFETSAGWYPGTWEAWRSPDAFGRSFSLPSWTNTAVYPGGRQDPEILELERTLGDDLFSERCGGVPVPPKGRVFKRFSFERHVRSVDYLPGLPVGLAIDPGYAGAYCVLAVQVVNGFVRVFDEIYETGLITSEIIDICTRREWWRDVSPVEVVSDIAAKQHQAQQSVAETWREKTGITLAMQQVGIQDGIDRVRTFLSPNPLDGESRLLIDTSCEGLTGEMIGSDRAPVFGGYRYKTDDDGRPVSELPEDKHNHACKALAYYLVNRFGLVDRRRRQQQQQVMVGQRIAAVYNRPAGGGGRKLAALARQAARGR